MGKLVILLVTLSFIGKRYNIIMNKKKLNPLMGKKRVSSKRKMDLNKALILRAKGISYNNIAPLVGVSNGSVVRKGIENFLQSIPSDDILERLEKLKIPILKSTLGNLVSCLNDPDKIKSASLNNAAYAFTQVYNALRLEQGKSTSNISYADSLAALKAAKNELKLLNESNSQQDEEEPEGEYVIPVIKETA